MTLWLMFALMTAAAAVAVLWPLGRGDRARAAGSDIAVYQDQLAEIERDRVAGRIAEREAEAARLEVSRRLLGAADAAGARARQPAAAAGWRRRAAAAAALVLLPLGAAGLYGLLGSPDLPGEPLAGRSPAPSEQRSLATLISQVEAHQARNPEDGRGWEVLAPVYMRLGRFDDAVTARQHALRLLGSTVAREVELGEALAAQANGVITESAKTSFERALALDATDVRARFYLGLAAEQEGRRSDAAAIWRDLLAKAPAGAPWADFIRRALARVEGTVPAGPSERDMAAAADLTPQQRSEMVRGMVERLAERLKRDGSDVEGWLRLVRAYAVLGERDKAREAATEARRALAAEPDKVRRLEELVKGLGLEG
jgi:cytochrome c-type biogenesis protein CcmH